MRPLLLSVFVLLAACATGRGAAPSPEPASKADAAPAAKPGAVALPFHDDYATALAEAKQRGLPLFAYVWTSW